MSDVQSTLAMLEQLLRLKEAAGKCEVRLSSVFLPYSMVAVDLSKERGTMVVEYYTYRMSMGERPHVVLTPRGSDEWFERYRLQFEQVWADATPWMPATM